MKMYSLGDILTLQVLDKFERNPNKPDWANIRVSKIRNKNIDPQELGGGGVYACFWKERLIYIGLFVNDKNGHPFEGNVYSRIGKHAVGFLQRDHRLFFDPGSFPKVLNIEGTISCDLKQADWRVMTTDSGVCSTENKVRWAQRDWDFIKVATTHDIMKHFTFGYQRIEPPHGQKLPPKKWIREKWVKPIEKNLILNLNPPCNNEYDESRDDFPTSPEAVAKKFNECFKEAKYPAEKQGVA